MKVTFPHLGSMHIFCKAIAETAGIPYIVPPETSRKTLTLGVLHSNECICLPFKLILGNFIEALQMGADTIVMVGHQRVACWGDLCKRNRHPQPH